MFEKASRLKVRFDTPQGRVSTEDLWDLPLTGRGANLDDIARELHKALNSDEGVSFVVKAKKSDELIQLKFDLVKHVIDTRLQEQEEAAKAKERAEKQQKILGIIAGKEDEALASLPLEKLKKMAGVKAT